MMTIMYILGGFQFSSETIIPNTTNRANAYNWQSIQRMGREPARQAVGIGDETFSLRGVFYPCESDKVWTLDDLRRYANTMTPLRLMSMAGKIDDWAYTMGRWTVDNINEGRSALWPNGKPRKVEFDLSITRYGEDRDYRWQQ